MIAARPYNHTRRPHLGRERLHDLTHALEDTVIAVAEDRHAHRYMGQLAQMLGRIHELNEDSDDTENPASQHDNSPVVRLGVEELTDRTLWLQHDAAAHHDDNLARTFEGLHQRLASMG